MQCRAAGIQHQRRHILEEEELYLILHAGLPEPVHAVAALQALHNRLLDYALAVRNGGQRRADGVPLDRESILPPDPLLPREGVGAVEQLGETVRREVAQPDEHPLGTAQGQVGAGYVGFLPLKRDAPVHRFQTVQAEGVDLLSDLLFQTEHTGRN